MNKNKALDYLIPLLIIVASGRHLCRPVFNRRAGPFHGNQHPREGSAALRPGNLPV